MPWGFIYPFFLVHMLMFGGSGFVMAYSNDPAPVSFLYIHGGFAIVVYLVFYLAIFGLDQVRWMLINAGLGLYGIFAQIDWILAWFGKSVDDFPWYVHVIPFGYYVLYTFLLYRIVLHLAGAERSAHRREIAEWGYVLVSLLVYTVILFTTPG